MTNKFVVAIVLGGLATADAEPATAQGRPALIASFSDISEASFTVEAVGPREVIREYAACKAIWFAEKKGGRTMSLSDPAYGDPKADKRAGVQVPADWISLRTTAYLNRASPSGNPSFGIADKARQCRQMWDWYR